MIVHLAVWLSARKPVGYAEPHPEQQKLSNILAKVNAYVIIAITRGYGDTNNAVGERSGFV